MKLLAAIRGKKYRTRIFMWMTSVMVIIILLFSITIYLNAEKTVIENEYLSNQKVLHQLKFNIDFMDKIVKNLCLSTFYNRDIQSLMNYTGEETFEQIDAMGKFNNFISSNPYIQSIYVYNNRKNTFYSTYSSFKYQDEELKKIIKQYDVVPVLKPIVRKAETYKVGELVQYKDVLTYFMYEITDEKKQMNGAVILNIKLDWLMENINQINEFGKTVNDTMLIMDEKGDFLSSYNIKNENDYFNTELKKSYLNNQKKGLNADLYKCKLGGEDYLVSYFKINKADWVLFKVQPYNAVFDYINKLRTFIIIFTGLILVLILIASYSIASGLYKPLEGLLKQVNYNGSGDNNSTKKKGDEFVFLKNVYTQSVEKLQQYHAEKQSNEKMVQLYFIRKLISNSSSITTTEYEKNKIILGFKLEIDKYFVVVVLKIDNWKQFDSENDAENKELLKFATINIATEILSRSFQNEAVETNNDEIVILLNCNDTHNVYSQLNDLFMQIQQAMLQYYQVTFSISISDINKGINNITQLYNQALSNVKYRFIFGPMSIITPEELKSNVAASRMDYSFDSYKRLMDELSRGDIKLLDKGLTNIMKEVRMLEYNDMMLSLAYLVNITLTKIYELNETRKEPINAYLLSSNEIFEVETIEEFREVFLGIFAQVSSSNESIIKSKDIKLVESIKKIIDENYFDYNLSAAEIAAKLKLSPSKLSKVFKEHGGAVSIPEYINSIRLAKAVEWMENSKLSVGEIMYKVGFENESYFYKVFKAKYGTTPREYISSRSKR